jgi:hypothetical protein
MKGLLITACMLLGGLFSSNAHAAPPTLQELLTKAHTRYELSGTYDLSGGSVRVPENCVLAFTEGTKITNGTLVLNKTMFEGAKHCIAGKVSGLQEELDADFFDLTKDNKTLIMQSIVNTASKVQLHGRYEDVFDNIELGKKEVSLIGNGATIVKTLHPNTAAINILSDTFVRIVDLDFEIGAGYGIQKKAKPTGQTRLSYMIDRCRFKASSSNVKALIQLVSSREGNISNCFFEGTGESIGIDRTNAVNTNVISCMFSNLSYGIKAVGVPTDDDKDDLYSSYACGLNVQSAVMLGCTYGIFIEGNDSFFLNNSMIDYCVNPLVIISQDGANISNNYFATSTKHVDYSAVITIRNNPSKTADNENKRIIISNNSIYGHRTTNCYGIDMDVESIDCTIQGNTFDYFTDYGINLRHTNTGKGWSTEKLVIDNNRFHFGRFATKGNYVNMYGINGAGYTGGHSAIITNNYAIEEQYDDGKDIHISTKMIKADDSYAGNFLSFGNHDYLKEPPAGDVNGQAFNASRMNHGRMKISVTIPASKTTWEVKSPMPGESRLVVSVANNPCPINVVSIANGVITFSKAVTNKDVTFIAIIEREYNL